MEFSLHEFFLAYPWGLYACFILAPFVQEDAAVIGAASASATGLGDTGYLLLSILAGLTLSDLWKYWAGRAALTQSWAKKYADKPGVRNAKDRVVNRLASSLMVVRFVPGTRIPFYVASGFFKAPFDRFSLFVALSALAYIALVFGLFHVLGEVAGEQAKGWFPIIAIGLFVLILIAQRLNRTKSATEAAS